MGMQVSLTTLMPIAIGLALVGDAAIAFIYEGGAFTEKDTMQTYKALLYYLPIDCDTRFAIYRLKIDVCPWENLDCISD